MSSEVTKRFRNHYKCPQCGTDWCDEWEHTCDDRCPTCDTSVSPIESTDLENQRPMLCPVCGGEHGFIVHVTAASIIIRDYNDEVLSYSYDKDCICTCEECAYEGQVKDFRKGVK